MCSQFSGCRSHPPLPPLPTLPPPPSRPLRWRRQQRRRRRPGPNSQLFSCFSGVTFQAGDPHCCSPCLKPEGTEAEVPGSVTHTTPWPNQRRRNRPGPGPHWLWCKIWIERLMSVLTYTARLTLSHVDSSRHVTKAFWLQFYCLRLQ